MKHAIETEKIPLIYNSTEYDGKMILAAPSALPPPPLPAPKRLPNSNSMSLAFANGKQSSPPVKDYMCSIWFVDLSISSYIRSYHIVFHSSRIPCRGFYSFCGVCFHGGHLDHIRTWFRQHDECPTGCGHRCRDRDQSVRRSRLIAQRYPAKSSVVFQQ